MRLKSKLFIYLFLTCFSWASAQNKSATSTQEEAVERIVRLMIERLDEPEESEYWYEHFNQLYRQTISVNTANYQQWSELKILSPLQIQNILNYIKQNGNLLSLYELKLIEGLDNTSLQTILPFIRIDEAPRPQKKAYFSKNRLILRYERLLEKSKAYQVYKGKAPAYIGSPDKYYLKYQYQLSELLAFSFLAEKDPGEAFFKSPNKSGFDFYSAHLEVNNIGFIKKIVLGDYKIQFGQGLVLGNGFGNRKSSLVTQTALFSDELKAYSSSNEYDFFRGLATQFQVSKWTSTLFASYKKTDAFASEWNEKDSLFSFKRTGLHRTQREIEQKRQLGTYEWGGILRYSSAQFSAGALFISNHHQYDINIHSYFYQKKRYYQQSNMYGSAAYNWNIHSLFLSGEIAVNQNKDRVINQNILFLINSRVHLSLLYRYFSPSYFSPYAKSFSESSMVNNEEGLYLGIEIQALSSVNLKFYADYFRFPWWRFQTYKPSNGFDYFAELDYIPNAKIHFTTQYKYERQDKNITANKQEQQATQNTQEANKQTLRLDFKAQLNKQLSLKYRWVWSAYQQEQRENAYLIYQDINYQFNRIPLNSSLRLAFFNGDSYNTRIYTYERDVLYSFSIPAFYQKGIRFYALLKYQASPHLKIEVKASRTYFPFLKSIGSGNEKIEGNAKTQIKAQIIYKF